MDINKYLELGWHLLPIEPGTKKPAGGQGLEHASNDPAKIAAWQKRYKGCGWAVACQRSNLAVIDVDFRNDGQYEFDELALHGLPIGIECPTVSTGNGLHYYYSSPDKKLTGKLGNTKGIDIKHNGYVLLPPTIHPSGKPYEWKDWNNGITSLIPPEVLKLCEGTDYKPKPKQVKKSVGCTPYGLKALANEVEDIGRASEGDRNNALNKAAFSLHQLVAGGQLDEQYCHDTLYNAGLEAGLKHSETVKTIRSGSIAGSKTPREPEQKQDSEPGSQQLEPDDVFVIELSDWKNIEIKPTDWLIEGLLPRGVRVILASEMKCGKTYLTIDMALCLAVGYDCIIYPSVSGCKTLIYSPEGSEYAFAKRLHQMCWGRGIPTSYASQFIKPVKTRGLNFCDSRHLDAIKRLIDKEEPDLFILDPLINLHVGLDENSGEMMQLLNNITDFASDEMSIVLAHHQNKTAKGQSAFHGLRGHSSIGGWCDGIILLNRTDNEDNKSPRRVTATHRNEDSPTESHFKITSYMPEHGERAEKMIPNKVSVIQLQPWFDMEGGQL